MFLWLGMLYIYIYIAETKKIHVVKPGSPRIGERPKPSVEESWDENAYFWIG